ncbi:MAG: AAA family ATPase, partial [Burkholderiales bacterium]|nr:AAA family ATPase [Burkholderiales bacterium]
TPEDAPLPDGVLQSWLGSLQAQAFNRMYALDHTTLVEGGAGILSASDDIGRMLFQSASGVEHLGDALQKLQAEADALWAPRKSGTRAYYQALEAYEAAHAEFKRSTLRTKDWKAQHDALTATEAQLAEAKARDVELRQQLSRLERIRRVRPLLLAMDAARAQRTELLATGDIPLLEETAAQVFGRATQDIALADADISRLQREVDETQAGLLATVVDKNILALQEDITELNERRLQFRAHRTDMVKRAEEIRLEWVRAQELARSLDWPADSEEGVRQRLPATPLRVRLASLIKDRAALALDLKNARASLSDRQEQIQQGETELSQLEAGAVDPDLESAVEQAMKLGDHEKVMAELQDEIDGLTQRIEEALAALGAWHRPPESLRAMLVPDTSHIQSLIDHHRADAAEEKTYRDALDAKAKEVAQQELDLQQFVRNFQPVSREQVLEARSARDASWQGIKQAPQSLLERSAGFEAQISEADKLADDRLDRAQYEADRQSKTDTLEHKQREHLDLEHRLQAVKSRMEERIAQWDALATACGLPALPMDMALTWLQLRQVVLDLVREGSAAERRRSVQQAAAAKIRDSLWNRLGHDASESPAPELSVCLREARALITKADQAQGQRKTLEKQIREGQRTLGKLRDALQAAQEDWDAWMQSWQVAVQSVGYGTDTPVDQVDAEIDVMQDVERLLDRIRNIRSERIETMRAGGARLVRSVT